VSIHNASMAQQHTHSHDGGPSHSHANGSAADHGHTHEILDGPGSYLHREMPIIEGRDWKERAFTIGIGGYVVDPHHKPLPEPGL
jgi:urease accessory protein